MLEGLLRPPSGDVGIDRKALAGLLLEIAQSLKPELRAQQNGVLPADLRLDQLFEGRPTVLVEDGKVLKHALAKELLTRADLVKIGRAHV